MAVFESTQSGNWNDGATWGNSSPGTKGTDWPGLTGDYASVMAGDTVTYNVVETNVLEDVIVEANGTLQFATNQDTQLTIGTTGSKANFYIFGTLKVGTIATPVDAAYTAKIIIKGDFEADVACPLFSLCGDPDVFGSTPEATIYSNWTTGQTFTITGDYTSLWSSGQSLVLVKDGEYSSKTTDCVNVTIDTIALNGANTDITINESFPGGSYSAGATVWHLTRNVLVSLNGSEDFVFGAADSTGGGLQTFEGPDVVIDSVAIINIYDYVLRNCDLNNVVIWGVYNSFSFLGCIGDYNIFGFHDYVGGGITCSLGRYWTFLGNDSYYRVNRSTLKYIRFILHYQSSIFTDDTSECKILLESYKNYATGTYGLFTFQPAVDSHVTGHFGENANGLSYWVDDNIFAYWDGVSVYSIGNCVLKGARVPVPVTELENHIFSDPDVPRAAYFESVNGSSSTPRLFCNSGSAEMIAASGGGDLPYQRAEGNLLVWQLAMKSSCNYLFKVLIPIRFSYYATASGSKTFSCYLQTNYTSDIKSLITLAHRGVVDYSIDDIAPRSSKTDWTQAASVTTTLPSAGWVSIAIYVWGYESGRYIWIDPVVEVT